MSTVKEAIEAHTEALEAHTEALAEVHDLVVIIKEERAQALAMRQTTAGKLEVERNRWEIIGDQVRAVAKSSEVRLLIGGFGLLALNRLLEYLSR